MRRATSPARSSSSTAAAPLLSRRELSGLDFLRRMIAGEVPHPPLVALLGIRVVEVTPGRAVLAAEPAPAYYNGLGTIHGGFTATLLDTALGAAVNPMMPAGRAFTTVDLKVTLLRPILRHVGEVRCVAESIHVGGRVATSEGRIVDGSGKLYAHGTATHMVVEVSPMAELVRYEIRDDVAVLTIDNPPVNALSPAVWDAVSAAGAARPADPPPPPPPPRG